MPVILCEICEFIADPGTIDEMWASVAIHEGEEHPEEFDP